MRRALSFAFALAACGGSQARPETPQPVAPAPSSTPAHANSTPAPASDGCPASAGGMSIEGQLGTLPQARVRAALREAEARLTTCYTRRLAEVPCLAGRVEFELRVGTDGTVRWAIPTTSTLGDGQAEGCMRDELARTDFGRACGGDARVTWSMEFDGGPDVRAPTAWPATRLDALRRQHRAALEACRNAAAGPVPVTLYAAPDGAVASVGASVPTPASAPVAECVLRVVRAWRLPSPGSWYARTSLQLP